jgi:sporulation protein YlmC with PRC-barrel domain
MLIKGTTLINKQIRSTQDASFLGRVADLIIDPENGKLLALKLRSKIFQPKIICTIDIQGYTPLFLVAKDDSVVVSAEEVIRVKNVIDKKIMIIGNKVKTEAGKKLGICEDILIDTSTCMIIKFYVKASTMLGPLQPDLIIPSSRVVRIDRDAIVVKENGAKEKVAVAAGIAEPAE